MHFLLATLPADPGRTIWKSSQASVSGARRADAAGRRPSPNCARPAFRSRSAVSGYRTDKRQVRMEYLDDLDISEFSCRPSRHLHLHPQKRPRLQIYGILPNKSEKSRAARKSWRNMKRCYESEPDGEYRSPVYGVRAVRWRRSWRTATTPTSLRRPKMRLLELSIWETAIRCRASATTMRELVDGYHRYLVPVTSKRIYERERGLLLSRDRQGSVRPHGVDHSLQSARGMHNIELMSEIVAELTRAQMSDQWIMRHIGMDRDELLRLKQITGLDALSPTGSSAGDAPTKRRSGRRPKRSSNRDPCVPVRDRDLHDGLFAHFVQR